MNHLGVFAKYWQPGRVKTRLADAIGPENAAELYREFIRQTLARQRETADDRRLYVWPSERLSEFQAMALDNWSLALQPAGDLGHKMLDFFERTLHPESGISGSVLIGSDTPVLDPALVQQAFQLLHKHDCVLGPACDGGYYLIGLRQVTKSLFADIHWSTPQVFPQTTQRLEQLGWSWAVLSEESDIDDLADLRALQLRLTTSPQPSALDLQLLAAVRQFGGGWHE